jgi:predicted metal-dependent hydrolase
MQVRVPDIDFSNVAPIWAPANPGFGHRYDAASILLPYLEPYLIRVMRDAQQRLRERGIDTSKIDKDIELFNKQEGQHYQLHMRYNEYLKSHYPGLDVYELEIKADFERIYSEESLEFNMGYSVGFETIGPISTGLWFTLAKEARAGSDPNVDTLWGWHLAEEFEHRHVAHEVYQALGGGWLFRQKMFSYQAKHLGNFSNKVRQYMMEEDDRAGRFPLFLAQELWQKFKRRFTLHALPKMLSVSMPWHNPSRARVPAESQAMLDRFS